MSHVITVPLGYKHVFNHVFPVDHLKIISQYPKEELIRSFVYLIRVTGSYNHRLIVEKDLSAHAQFLEEFELEEELRFRVLKIVLQRKEVYSLICGRETILFAIEEVLNSDIKTNEDFFEMSVEFKHAVFCYLLKINDIYFESKLPNEFDLEDFNASLLPSNNSIVYNGFRCILKGYKLYQFLIGNDEIKQDYNDYISQYFGVIPKDFFAFFIRRYDMLGYLEVKKGTKDLIIFNALTSNITYESSDVRKLSLVRLFPVYKISTYKYIILDTSFFIGKLYYQFIYDFWFNYLKSRNQISAKRYFGLIGQFFENYTADILKSVFSYLHHPVPKATHELKFKWLGKTMEYTDFYA